MEFISIEQILQSVLSLVFAITAIRLGLSVMYFAMIYLIVNLIVLGYNVVITAWKFLKPKIEVDLSFWKGVVKEAWPFALTAVFVSIYYWIDSVMLSYMKGDEVVGWYNAAYRLILFLLVIPSIYFTTLYPIMSRLFESSKDSLKLTFERSFKYMSMLAFPIGVGTTLLADRIIILIFGPEYMPASRALQILIWSVVCIYLSSSYGQLVRSSNKQDIEMKITAIGAVLNTVLNFIFIPKFSYVGASVTTLATEFFVLLVYIYVLCESEISIRHLGKHVGRALIASIIMGVFVWSFANSANSNIFIIVVIAAVIYFTSYFFILKGFDSIDAKIINSWSEIGKRRY